MSWTTLVDPEALAVRLDECVVVDCRHDLLDPRAGLAAYRQGHLPGSFFLSQDDDLAGAKDGRNGRHPLPERAALRARLHSLGLVDGRQLVAYDQNGGNYAARLWWLARWLGHAEVAVLDGGLDAWTRAGLPLAAEPTPLPAGVAGTLGDRPSLAPHVDAHTIATELGTDRRVLIDARTAERYRGETEPIDPIAGHIPGASNRPHGSNLRPDGRFKPAPVLRAEFESLIAGHSSADTIHYCGSGVTACHNLLAMEVAGLAGAALYPGSWSEWISDRSRPIATGAAR